MGNWLLGSFRETDPNYPKSFAGTHKKLFYLLTPHFISNEVLLKYQDHLKVESYLFLGNWETRLLEFKCQFLVRGCLNEHVENVLYFYYFPISF